MQIGFDDSGMSQYYKRTYKKIQNSLADLGGFIKALSIIAQLVNYIYSKTYFYYNFCFNSYIPIDFSESKKEKSFAINIKETNNTHSLLYQFINSKQITYKEKITLKNRNLN